MTTLNQRGTTMTTSTETKQAIARTMFRQIGKLRLSVLKASNMVYKDAEGSDVTVRFLIGSQNAQTLRMIEITYKSGPDTYEVRSYASTPLTMTAAGTSMGQIEKYSVDNVYCDSLGETVIAAARAAGARPRI